MMQILNYSSHGDHYYENNPRDQDGDGDHHHRHCSSSSMSSFSTLPDTSYSTSVPSRLFSIPPMLGEKPTIISMDQIFVYLKRITHLASFYISLNNCQL